MQRNRSVASFVVVVAVLLGGCTKSNPRSCADGTCSEAEFPFCDVDGALGGVPNACISVECTAGEHVACRGDNAITCNAEGSDYDLVQCPLGCSDAAGGCNECTTTAQCDNPSPVCDDSTKLCRQCRTDDECPSLVCDQGPGTCVEESRIVYASGQGTGQCSRTQPCPLSQAVSLAATTSPTPLIRMLPGTFTLNLNVAGAHALDIVASGASIVPADASTAVVVSDGASVTIRGLRLVQAKVVACDSTVTARSSLSLRDGSVFATGNGTVMNVRHCSLSLTNMDIDLNGNEIALVAGDASTVRGDRLHLHGSTSHYIFASEKGVDVQFTNSLFVDVGLALSTTDTGPPGSQFTFAEDTFVLTADFSLSQGCEGAAFRTVRYENSIISPLGMFDAVTGAACTFHNTLLSHQAAPPTGTFVSDPGFASSSARDFHLTPGSVAVDRAVVSVFGLDSSADLEGTVRPQGTASDLGAYELVH